MQTTWITEIKQAPSLRTFVKYFWSIWHRLCMLISPINSSITSTVCKELLPSNETSWDIEDKYTIKDKYRMTKFATIL